MWDTSKMDTPFRSRRAQRDEADKPVHIPYIIYTIPVVVAQSNKDFNIATQSFTISDYYHYIVSTFHFLCSSFYNRSQSMAAQ